VILLGKPFGTLQDRGNGPLRSVPSRRFCRRLRAAMGCRTPRVFQVRRGRATHTVTPGRRADPALPGECRSPLQRSRSAVLNVVAALDCHRPGIGGGFRQRTAWTGRDRFAAADLIRLLQGVAGLGEGASSNFRFLPATLICAPGRPTHLKAARPASSGEPQKPAAGDQGSLRSQKADPALWPWRAGAVAGSPFPGSHGRDCAAGIGQAGSSTCCLRRSASHQLPRGPLRSRSRRQRAVDPIPAARIQADRPRSPAQPRCRVLAERSKQLDSRRRFGPRQSWPSP